MKNPTTLPTEQGTFEKDIAYKNPSYDKSLPIEKRLRDFMGAFHLELNGVNAHEPFYLKYEGRPNERCDDDAKNEFVRFVNILAEDIRTHLLTEIEREVEEQSEYRYERNYIEHGPFILKYDILTLIRKRKGIV